MAFTILEIKNASFKAALGVAALVEYADAVDNAALASTSTTNTWAPINGVNQQTASPLTETITLNLGQDLKTGSLWLFLRSAHGQAGKIEFFPQGGTTPKVAADVVFQAPAAVGGGAGTIPATTCTLLVKGLATITPAP
jgi:hypothetical protein